MLSILDFGNYGEKFRQTHDQCVSIHFSIVIVCGLLVFTVILDVSLCYLPVGMHALIGDILTCKKLRKALVY